MQLQRLIQSQDSAVPAWTLLATLYIFSLVLLWPGVMSPDAIAQYAAAMSGIYTDHHPPLMGFVWRHLAQIYPGPASLFILHLTMLYSAAAIFIYIFRQSKFKWWYAVYPILPNILAYTALIVKDTGFTYTYLLSGALMAYMIIERVTRRKLTFISTIILLLFYGTAVKFQAKYLLIFFTWAIAYCIFDYKFSIKSFLTGIMLYAAILFGINLVNQALVPEQQKLNTWQWVKIYDLSAISLYLNTPLYPNFILEQENFSFAKVQTAFDDREVDPLVFGSQPIIRSGDNQQQRDELWQYWFNTVTHHPFLYLRARANLFKYNLITAPCDRNNPVQFLTTTALAPLLAIPGISSTLDAGYLIFKIALRFVWLLPLLFIYMIICIKNFSHSRFCAPALLFTLTSLSLLAVLFFCSMAGTARYVFLCTCLMHASHGFVFRVLQGTKVRQTELASASCNNA